MPLSLLNGLNALVPLSLRSGTNCISAAFPAKWTNNINAAFPAKWTKCIRAAATIRPFMNSFTEWLSQSETLNFLELWVDLLNVSEWSELEQDLLWRLSGRWGTLRHERHNYMTYGKDRVRVKKRQLTVTAPPTPPPPPPPSLIPGCCWVLLYVHRNHSLIRDGSPGR